MAQRGVVKHHKKSEFASAAEAKAVEDMRRRLAACVSSKDYSAIWAEVEEEWANLCACSRGVWEREQRYGVPLTKERQALDAQEDAFHAAYSVVKEFDLDLLPSRRPHFEAGWSEGVKFASTAPTGVIEARLAGHMAVKPGDDANDAAQARWQGEMVALSSFL